MYEYGAQFNTAAKKRGAFRPADEWWFVQSVEITRKLMDPHVEKFSSNRSLYYFDDFTEEKRTKRNRFKRHAEIFNQKQICCFRLFSNLGCFSHLYLYVFKVIHVYFGLWLEVNNNV